MNALLHIAERVINRPLLMHPQHAHFVLSMLRDRLIPGGTLEVPMPDMSQFAGKRQNSDGTRTLARKKDGVAIISVLGSLVNRGAWLDADICTGLTSYEGISAQLAAAVADKSVNSILLDVDSPGGEASGMFGLASSIRDARKTKHVVAVVNDMAASAAYGIPSGADEIVISPTSMVGSIGVVLMHVDYSASLKEQGIKPTLIHAGAHKVDGNPFEPLSDAVKSDLQKQVDAYYTKFVEAVWRGRADRLTAEAARGTEARVFIGQDAITQGLADRIGTFDQVLAELSSRSAKGRSKTTQPGASKMSNTEDTISRADHDAAVAKAKTEGENGIQAALTAERTRAAGIMGLEAAKGREAQANALVSAGVTVEAAKGILEAAPKADAAPARTLGHEADLGGADPAVALGKVNTAALWDKSVAAHNARNKRANHR